MEFLQRLPQRTEKIKLPDFAESFNGWKKNLHFLEKIKTIGLLKDMDDMKSESWAFSTNLISCNY
jgi:hypothetical protein